MIETIATAILGCVCGNISAFLFFPQTRKAKALENDGKQSAEWERLYREIHEKLDVKEQKIDTLYSELSEHRDKHNHDQVKMTELEVENARLKILKCEKPACPNRQPPTGF
jgi:peptidoglycan hydrolase CwlO-like protein